MCQIFYRDNGEVMSIEDRVKKIVSDQLGKSLDEMILWNTKNINIDKTLPPS